MKTYSYLAAFVFLGILTMAFTVGVQASGSPNNSTFVVNTIADTNDGVCDNAHCSLREAINAANAQAKKNTIKFKIPGCGPGTLNICTIVLLNTELPHITDTVNIDGSIKESRNLPGHPDRRPGIELDGSNVIGSGFTLRDSGSSGSTIRGFVIRGFKSVNPGERPFDDGVGIRILGSNENTIAGNYLGTDKNGVLNNPVRTFGIALDGGNRNMIGGYSANDRNVIINGHDASEEPQDGIFVGSVGFTQNAVADKNQVIGNFVGVTAQGDVVPIASSDFEGAIELAAQDIFGGCGGAGQCQVTNTLVANNVTASYDIGILMISNVIDAVIKENRSFSNRYDGIYIDSFHPAALPRNLLIVDNIIGFDLAGQPAGNTWGLEAITVKDSLIINNTIANSLAEGINVADLTVIYPDFPASEGISILSNRIYDNGALGIDLIFDFGVTPNDLGDLDEGANNLQNFPLLSEAKKIQSSSVLRVVGSLDSAANTKYLVQFFANDKAITQNVEVVAGEGNVNALISQGKIFLGSKYVVTDANGHANFNYVVLGVNLPNCSIDGGAAGPSCITSTATRIDKHQKVTDTSEFSPAVVVTD